MKSRRFKTYFLFMFLLLTAARAYSQTFNVRGNISTTTIPVSYASVTFTDKSDTTKKFSTVTDTLGNYRLSVITAVEDDNSVPPASMELAYNYPNPFSSETAITYRLNKHADVNLRIYDILGREVKTFRIGTQTNGIYSIRWGGTDNLDNKVSPGIYFYKLQADTEIQIKKMLFGVGETNVLVPFSNAVAAPKMELRKETRRHIKPGTYAVQIRNTGSTKPRIQAKEFDELTIQSDTTLNFVVEAVKGHFLYVGNRGYRDVFVVDTESNVIVDTIKLSNGVGTLAITKSGAKLYVGYGTISLVDLTTRNSRTIYDQSIAATLFTALNGSVFVVSRVHYEAPWTLGMVDTVSDVVSIIDTLDLDSMGAQEQQVAFLPNAPVLFTVSKEKKLYTYNYATKQVVRKYANLYDPLNLVISPDGQRLYCTIYADRLAVFDLWEDRIVAIVEANHRGKLMLSPDGQYLYITDPASEIPELIPSGKVYIFHTGTNTYVGDIDVKNMVPHGRSWGTDHIVLMPDGKTAFVSNGLTLIFVIDVVSRKVITAIEPRETEVQLEPMVLGPKQ